MPGTPPDREALLLELEQGLESFRHITTLIMQVLGILVAADAVQISYGISQSESAVLLGQLHPSSCFRGNCCIVQSRPSNRSGGNAAGKRAFAG